MRALNEIERKGMWIRENKIIEFDFNAEIFRPFSGKNSVDGADFAINGFVKNDIRRKYVIISAKDIKNEWFDMLELGQKKEFTVMRCGL